MYRKALLSVLLSSVIFLASAATNPVESVTRELKIYAENPSTAEDYGEYSLVIRDLYRNSSGTIASGSAIDLERGVLFVGDAYVDLFMLEYNTNDFSPIRITVSMSALSNAQTEDGQAKVIKYDYRNEASYLFSPIEAGDGYAVKVNDKALSPDVTVNNEQVAVANDVTYSYDFTVYDGDERQQNSSIVGGTISYRIKYGLRLNADSYENAVGITARADDNVYTLTVRIGVEGL